uniref:Uncharacterized protein n=2 Tax=Timema TaxID=61471 RepID=A0A7R9EY82_9NEOP|nr:unnamed protein product [Timema bartmani]
MPPFVLLLYNYNRFALLVALVVTYHPSCGLQFGKEVPILSREVRGALFPESSSMGLYLAVAIPLDLPDKDVSVSWNFEANYALPYNATELSYYGYARRQERSLRDFTRSNTYQMIRNKFESHGEDGESCLLRTICESSGAPLRGTSFLGDILHVVFTPSSSNDEEDLGPEYYLAERQGLNGEDCEMIYEDCSLSLLELITNLEEE